MNVADILNLRLHNQQISIPKSKSPEDLVSYLGAVQSQDYYGAAWALGLRIPGSTFLDIEDAFNKGKILRTHALRPTWHFVTPQDLRWIMELNAPQVKKTLGYYNKALNLDEKLFEKTNRIIKTALKGKFLTRPKLQKILNEEGIDGTGQRMGHIIGWAELDNIICSGPREGKQFTYALINERAPITKPISRDESLSKLAKIFFETRGPATLKDFSKWSYLTLTDCKKALDSIKSKLQNETIGGKEYYIPKNHSSLISNHQPVLLLPNYDEYVSSYADYSVISYPETEANLRLIGNAQFWNHMVLNGKIIGSWRRIFKPKTLEIEFAPQLKLSKEDMELFEKEAEKFVSFFSSETTIKWL